MLFVQLHLGNCMFVAVFSDSADKVLQGTGKFEELIVSSHEIAASTAQLVSFISC